jgi:hypothetical protein
MSSTWLDIVGSVIMGTLAIFLILKMNMQISTNSSEITTNGMVQGNLSTLGTVVENDLYKIGYRITGDKISKSSLNNISYLTDLNNNGTSHIVSYYLGDTSQANFTSNPNDKPLFKVIDNGPPQTMSLVRDCQFTYYDSTGTQIADTSVTGRRKIKIIKVYLRFESAYIINNYYQMAEYSRKIRPANLK